MTTIVYHNGILAADRRVSNMAGNSDGFKCVHCNKPSRRVKDDTTKIELFVDKLFNGEKLICAGIAGRLDQGKRALDLLRASKDLKEAEEIVKLSTGAGMFENVSLLVVTTGKVYLIDFYGREKMKTEIFALTDTAAIGLGSMAAKLFIKMHGANAVDAIKAAMLVDDSTGGDINWITCGQEQEHAFNTSPNELKAFTEKYCIKKAAEVKPTKKSKSK